MTEGEKEEALMDIVTHYGLAVLLEQFDVIVDRISRGILSVPLDKDPEKASLQLYAERMKGEGALAARTALINRIDAIKSRRNREGMKK